MAKHGGTVEEQAAAAASYQREVAAVRDLSPEAFSALLTAGPQRSIDIGRNIGKLAEAMSDEQRAQLAQILAMRNHMEGRAKPMTQAMVDEEAAKIVQSHSPEDWIDVTKTRGLKDPAEWAAVNSVAAMFGKEVDLAHAHIEAARLEEGHARATGNTAARTAALKTIEQWEGVLGQNIMKRDAAVFSMLPVSTNTARMLAFMRPMIHPLTAEETFAARFRGVLKASGIKQAEQDRFMTLFRDTVDPALNGGRPDWTRFVKAFREATQPRWHSKALEFWKAGLLGLPTQMVNIGTNAAFLGLRNAENAVSSISSHYFAKARGKEADRFLGETAARGFGGKLGFAEAWDGLKADLSDIARLRPPDPQRKLAMGTFYDDPGFRQMFGAIEGKKGEFIRMPFKMLDAADNFFKHIIRNQEWAAQAHRLAQSTGQRSPGESTSHATSRILDELRRVASNPLANGHLYKKEGYKAAIEAGRNAAINDTFQEALAGNPVRQAVHSWSRATNQLPGLQLITPFVKTPYNIIAESLKRTPIAAAWAIKKFYMGEIKDAQFVEELVKSAMGTAAMAVIFQEVLAGNVTGGGPTDPKEAELLKQTGWQPYSFKVPGTNSWYSYQRLAPFSIMMGSAADMAEAYSRRDIDSAGQLLDKTIQAGTDNILDQSFITGFSNFSKMVTDPKRQGAAAARQLQASLIPNVVGVVPFAHAARGIDPNYRETEAYTLSPWMAQIPFVSKLLPSQFTPTGEERLRKGSSFERTFSPIMQSEIKTGAVAEAAAEVARVGPALSAPPLYFKVGTDKVYYSQFEREEIARAQQRGMEKIAQLIRSPSYQSLPDADDLTTAQRRTKRDAIQEVIDRYKRPVTTRINRIATRRAQVSGDT